MDGLMDGWMEYRRDGGLNAGGMVGWTDRQKYIGLNVRS